MPTKKTSTPPRPPATDEAMPRYRSGAVARMVRMPVATLRIWERRYRVAAPAVTATGHRLYSAADVQRLTLLKQLTELGHAIGAIASLETAQLHQVASTHAGALASRSGTVPSALPWRVLIVGAALARRLERPALSQRLGRPLKVTAVVDALVQLDHKPGDRPAETLLLHAPVLTAETLAPLHAAARACGAPQIAVVYGYASGATCDALEAAGVAMLREPRDDRALGAWLKGLGALLAAPASAPNHAAGDAGATPDAMGRAGWAAGSVTPRRYDDATLTAFASLSSTIACECPRHVADLLMQLSHFEAYSAECLSRSPADTELHAYLQHVSGAARAMFETALERVAIQEGLMLPT